MQFECDEYKNWGSFVHDFFEFFWIEEGSCLFCSDQDTPSLFETNRLGAVQPGQVHEFAAVSPRERRFRLTSVLVRKDYMDLILEGYPELLNILGSFESKKIRGVTLSAIQKAKMAVGLDRLTRTNAMSFQEDLFVLGLFDEIRLSNASDFGTISPAWLRETLALMRLPANFIKGAAQFSRVSGRSSEHVCRLLRRELSMTPGQLLRRFRMEYAANRLLTTDVPIVNLASECGYESLSQFYKVFKHFYATTPAQFRLHGSNKEFGVF